MNEIYIPEETDNKMRFNEDWYDYERRCGDVLGRGMKVAWTADIISCDGANYHFWFPKCKGQALRDLKKEARYHASHQGDPVSFSYAWLPEGVTDDGELDTNPTPS